jgi:hypothetical protein
VALAATTAVGASSCQCTQLLALYRQYLNMEYVVQTGHCCCCCRVLVVEQLDTVIRGFGGYNSRWGMKLRLNLCNMYMCELDCCTDTNTSTTTTCKAVCISNQHMLLLLLLLAVGCYCDDCAA